MLYLNIYHNRNTYCLKSECTAFKHDIIFTLLPFLQCVLISYLIAQRIGWAAIVGVIGLLIKTIPVQTGLSRLSSKLRLKVALRTDARVGIMNEIIQGMLCQYFDY